MERKGRGNPETKPVDGPAQADLLERARRAAIDGIVETLAAIHRAGEAEERAAERGSRGSGRDDGPPRIGVDATHSAGDLLFDLARMQVDIIEKALSFQRKYGAYLAERALGIAPAGKAPPRLLVLRGLAGQSTEAGAFVIENGSASPMHVTLRLTALRARGDEEAAHRVPARFLVDGEPATPKDLVIGPDQELEIKVIVELDRRFEAGRRYRGHLLVAAPGRPKMKLPVRVDVKKPLRPKAGA